MENGTHEQDLIDVRSQPLIGLSQFTESVAAYERTLKELDAVKADRDGLKDDVRRLSAALDLANVAAADAHEQLRQEREKIGEIIARVTSDADQRVEEANTKLNVEIANRAHYEAFVAGIKAQFDGFELPAAQIATVRKPTNGKKNRGHSISVAEAAAKNEGIVDASGQLTQDMKDKIADAFGSGGTPIV